MFEIKRRESRRRAGVGPAEGGEGLMALGGDGISGLPKELVVGERRSGYDECFDNHRRIGGREEAKGRGSAMRRRSSLTRIAEICGTILLLSALGESALGQRQYVRTANASKTTDREAPPLITSVFPPALMIGKETKLAVEGANLKTVEDFLVSGTGVEATSFRMESETKGTVVLKTSADAEAGTRELRATGVGGLSNILVVRIDRLDQSLEKEPNDAIEQAGPISPATATVGRLTPRDLDHYRIEGEKGKRITVEIEAQRLGSPVAPVLTMLTSKGVALAQERGTRGLERDCRLSFRFPRDGVYVLQVRDATYSGNASAVYRLRWEEAPYASAIFPLGGPKGATIRVELSGGNLPSPVEKTVVLPDEAGRSFDPGEFESAAGKVRAPGKLAVDDSSIEVFEREGTKPTPLPLGGSANGRIGRKGEVDRYTVSVKKGVPILLSVRAATLGSWLDSVLTLRDAKGNVVAESDDPGFDPSSMNNNPFFNNNGQSFPRDSRIEYVPTSDGELTAEIEDRFGEFGPEYAYRLDYGPPRSDFSLKLLLSNPAARLRAAAVNGRVPRFAPGTLGAFNVKPGATVPINFLIESSGRTDPIEVTIEGLPPGVSCKPATIRLPRSLRIPGAMNRPNPPAGGVVLARVSPKARPNLGWIRVVARSKGGASTRRVGSYAVPIETGPGDPNENRFGFGQAEPPTRTIESIPFRVLGDPAEFLYGPPRPTTLTIRETSLNGALLQGGSVDATLVLDPGADAFKASWIRLTAIPFGTGITAEPIGVEAFESKKEEKEPSGLLLATVRLRAAPDAALGAGGASLKVAPIGGESVDRTVFTAVWRPFSLHLASRRVSVSAEGSGSLYIGVERAPGFVGPVDLKLEPLPAGVTIVGPTRVAPDQSGLTIALQGARSISSPQTLTVSGVATMDGGQVRVESAERAILGGRAEKSVR